jgi:hypothetical protein
MVEKLRVEGIVSVFFEWDRVVFCVVRCTWASFNLGKGMVNG